jgi:hypothetical protein
MFIHMITTRCGKCARPADCQVAALPCICTDTLNTTTQLCRARTTHTRPPPHCTVQVRSFLKLDDSILRTIEQLEPEESEHSGAIREAQVGGAGSRLVVGHRSEQLAQLVASCHRQCLCCTWHC